MKKVSGSICLLSESSLTASSLNKQCVRNDDFYWMFLIDPLLLPLNTCLRPDWACWRRPTDLVGWHHSSSPTCRSPIRWARSWPPTSGPTSSTRPSSPSASIWRAGVAEEDVLIPAQWANGTSPRAMTTWTQPSTSRGRAGPILGEAHCRWAPQAGKRFTTIDLNNNCSSSGTARGLLWTYTTPPPPAGAPPESSTLPST